MNLVRTINNETYDEYYVSESDIVRVCRQKTLINCKKLDFIRITDNPDDFNENHFNPDNLHGHLLDLGNDTDIMNIRFYEDETSHQKYMYTVDALIMGKMYDGFYKVNITPENYAYRYYIKVGIGCNRLDTYEIDEETYNKLIQ